MHWRIVSALSITHLISYGTLFYAFALLIAPMERELGWSKTALTGAFSLALISSAFFAVPVGRLIDRGYGRAVMTGGSVLAALLLVLWAFTDSYPVFLLIWLGMGAATSALFYEAGFAVLALNLGLLARRGITIITLVAGFASTVFIPLLHVLIDRFGWRDTILAMAALNIGICAVLHASSIPTAPARMQDRSENRATAPSLSNPPMSCRASYRPESPST
jgi:MFS family permease